VCETTVNLTAPQWHEPASFMVTSIDRHFRQANWLSCEVRSRGSIRRWTTRNSDAMIFELEQASVARGAKRGQKMNEWAH